MTNAASGRPTASIFFDVVVYLLGNQSGYQPYIGVPHDNILNEALRLVGINPDECPWPLHGREGLFRRVHFAWRNQAYPECGNKEALTAKPACQADENGKLHAPRGEWALTWHGVRKALALRPVFENGLQNEQGPNLTAQWLTRHWKVYDRAVRHVGRKLQRSLELSKVEDHVCNYFKNLITRDGLRDRLEAGRKIAPSQICAWAYRQACSDIRDDSRRPVCRTLHGALTKKERDELENINWVEQVIPNTINHSERLQVSNFRLAVGDYGSDAPTSSVDFIMDEHDVEKQAIGQEAANKIVARMNDIIKVSIAPEKDPEWHALVAYERFVKEMTIKEIAASRGLNYDNERNKITGALKRVRDAMLRARNEGVFDDVSY